MQHNSTDRSPPQLGLSGSLLHSIFFNEIGTKRRAASGSGETNSSTAYGAGLEFFFSRFFLGIPTVPIRKIQGLRMALGEMGDPEAKLNSEELIQFHLLGS